MVCTSLGSLSHPLSYFLCSILLIHRVLVWGIPGGQRKPLDLDGSSHNLLKIILDSRICTNMFTAIHLDIVHPRAPLPRPHLRRRQSWRSICQRRVHRIRRPGQAQRQGVPQRRLRSRPLQRLFSSREALDWLTNYPNYGMVPKCKWSSFRFLPRFCWQQHRGNYLNGHLVF